MKGKHKEGGGGAGGWGLRERGGGEGEVGEERGARNTGDVVCCGPIKPQDVTVVDRGR